MRRLICGGISALFLVCTTGCNDSNIIEIPLTRNESTLTCNIGAIGLGPNSSNPDSPWAKTYLKPTALPDGLQDIQVGDIESNIYQSTYQNYLAGNISKEWYAQLQDSWDWTPDTLNMSRTPIRTKALFAYGKDKQGKLAIVVDCNNNLDLSDDPYVYPHNSISGKQENIDSIAEANKISVVFETFTGNRTVKVTRPIFIKIYDNDENMIFYNIMEHMSARYKGREIVVISGTQDLSYKEINLAFMDELRNDDGRFNRDCTIYTSNEFICIGNTVYRIIGVNPNKCVLRLERISTPKDELQSPQAGFHAPDFKVAEFGSKDTVSLSSFRGKYLLIDYWATWCGPCRRELPMLKEIYGKTDRSKFEILGFVGDSRKEDLTKMIEEYDIAWKQVMADKDNGLKEKYLPEGYPSTYLIGPDGVVIAKNLRGKRLEEKIMSLLK